MNHALDSASYGASRELYSGHDNYGVGEPVAGMEFQPPWEYIQSGGKLGKDVQQGAYGDLLPEEVIEIIREKIRASRLSLNTLARNIGFSSMSIYNVIHGKPRANNKTYKALKAYFGLEG